MQVAVRFFGNYRALLDSAQLTLDFDADRATPLEVLNALGERFGSGLRTALLVDRGGEAHLKPGIRIAIGDEIIDSSADLRTLVLKRSSASDKPIRVFVFPSLMGGR